MYTIRRFFLGLVVSCTCSIARADVTICFESDSVKGGIELKMSIKDDGSGTVRYKVGTSDIEILRISEKTVLMKKIVPATVQSIWDEKINSIVSGKYYLITNGANVESLTYVRAKDKRRFLFSDSHQDPEFNCDWN